MSTTSQKHRNFIAEPMSDKPVTDLAGIGETLGGRLSSKGFDKVRTFCISFKCHDNVLCYTLMPNKMYSISGICRSWPIFGVEEKP